MKSLLYSIPPEVCERIANGKQTILLTKRLPKIDTPCKVYVYETKGLCSTPTFIDENGYTSYRGRGQVVGEFICDKILDGKSNVETWIDISANCGLSCSELYEFCGEDKYGETDYCGGLNITDLNIYDKPKELYNFATPQNIYRRYTFHKAGSTTVNGLYLTRPPAPYCYVEEL